MDPLPDWLQPFDEKLVDHEEQRVTRVEVHGDIQDDEQEREGVVAQGERASIATSTQASQSAGGSGTPN